jgi:dienelactone hydrolase
MVSPSHEYTAKAFRRGFGKMPPGEPPGLFCLEEQMPIKVECEDCGRPNVVIDSMAGRRVRCRACGKTFPVPAAARPGRKPIVYSRPSQKPAPPPLAEADDAGYRAGATPELDDWSELAALAGGTPVEPPPIYRRSSPPIAVLTSARHFLAGFGFALLSLVGSLLLAVVLGLLRHAHPSLGPFSIAFFGSVGLVFLLTGMIRQGRWVAVVAEAIAIAMMSLVVIAVDEVAHGASHPPAVASTAAPPAEVEQDSDQPAASESEPTAGQPQAAAPPSLPAPTTAFPTPASTGTRRRDRSATFRPAMPIASRPTPPATSFPPLPPAQMLGDDIRFYDVQLTGSGPGQSTHLWICLPAGAQRPGSLPCVFIAPAGSVLYTGMALSDGDRAEQLPYVDAGFAVVAYSLDGAPAGTNDADIIAAAPAFIAAHGGIDNAAAAIDYVLARVPQISKDRLYVAGHSSAATVALDVAAADPRIRACCAYCPVPNLPRHVRPQAIAAVRPQVPGFTSFLLAASPTSHASELSAKPVLLFTSDEDTTAPAKDVKAFAQQLLDFGSSGIKLVVAPHGDHYESMMTAGLPAGIEFLKSADASAKQ